MTWERLESATIGADLLAGQEARVADAMWMIGRQWQIGEITGDDAASPLLVEVEVEATPIQRFQPGPPERRAAIVDIDALDAPLEVAVEGEDPLASSASTRLAAEAGLQLFRLLADAEAPQAKRDALRTAFPLALPPDDELDPVGRAELELLARRSFDARALRAAASRPPDALRDARSAAALARWVAWYDELFPPVAPNSSSWQPTRMEYRFRLGAHPAGAGELTLEAPEYPGGHLDWYHFDAVAGGASLGTTPARVERTDTMVPTTATYAGQAASRWWELEDGTVWFGDVHAAPEDLAHLAVAAFGLSFGDDWYRVPIRIESNHLARVTRLVVFDTFGRTHRIRSCAELDGPGRPWRFFELTGDGAADAAALADRRAPWMFAAPALAAATEGRPREEVVLSRDEVANVGWAAELQVEAASGRVIDRTAAARNRAPAPAPAPAPRPPTGTIPGVPRPVPDPFPTPRPLPRPGDDDSPTAPEDAWRYQLAPEVPGHLVPLLPVELEGAAGLYLQRGRLATSSAGGAPVATQGALGSILEPDRRLLVEDAEVPTSGVTVTRSWQLARTSAGRAVLWLGRRKTVARRRRAPAVTFDTVEQSPRRS